MRKGKEDNITEILKLIAPGTPIRDGLENILRARTGALLLITDNNDVLKQVVDGGFTINEEYSSSKLYELFRYSRVASYCFTSIPHPVNIIAAIHKIKIILYFINNPSLKQ